MSRNNLFPVFLKLSQLKVLIVGGGMVAEEKLHFLLKSSPDARPHVVATEIFPATRRIIQQFELPHVERPFLPGDLDGMDLVIAATNVRSTNLEIRRLARERQILVNVADTPDLCDFYLGGIVTKGNVKVAISTNGKSPTLAKRLRQFLEGLLPEEIDQLAESLHAYRETLRDDFEYKVKAMNAATQRLVEH